MKRNTNDTEIKGLKAENIKLNGNIDMTEFIEKLIEKNLLDKEKLDNFLDKIVEKAGEKLAEYLINQDKEEDNKKYEEIGEDKEFVDDFDYENFDEKDIEDKEKNKELCDKFNKYTMILTPLEYARYKKFVENHIHRDIYTGAIGGSLSLNLTMTSIGVGKSCECSICGKIANITEYNW